MKPRQYKKNSKSAMDLLTSLFSARYYEDDFVLGLNFKGWEFFDKWTCETKYTHIILNELMQDEGFVFKNYISMFQYCRQLAKSGVKFR